VYSLLFWPVGGANVVELYRLWEKLSSESRLRSFSWSGNFIDDALQACHTPMFNDSHPLVRYAAGQCEYVPLSAVSLAYPTDLSKL
jgi:hypothetical protein